MLFNPLFFLVTVFLSAIYSFAVPIAPQHDLDIEARDDWTFRRGTGIHHTPPAGLGITRHTGELGVRAIPTKTSSLSPMLMYARDDAPVPYQIRSSLESRGIGDWFKNVGNKIKGGLQKAGGWVKDNWQTVAGVAMKFIP